MSSTTPRLGLISPTTTDQFELSDFVSNYAKLDQQPGVYVCTSATRPVWNSSKAGQLIMETDTKRMLEWDGSSWHDVQSSPPAWVKSYDPSTPINLSSNQNLQVTLGTISLRRPATIMTFTIANLKQMRYQSFQCNFYALIDNGYVGGYGGTTTNTNQWHTYGTEGNFNDYRVVPAWGMKSLPAGNHTLGIKIGTAQGTGSLMRATTMAIMVNSTDV